MSSDQPFRESVVSSSPDVFQPDHPHPSAPPDRRLGDERFDIFWRFYGDWSKSRKSDRRSGPPKSARYVDYSLGALVQLISQDQGLFTYQWIPQERDDETHDLDAEKDENASRYSIDDGFGRRLSLLHLAWSLGQGLWASSFLTDDQVTWMEYCEPPQTSTRIYFEKSGERIRISCNSWDDDEGESPVVLTTTLQAFEAGVCRFIDDLLHALEFHDPEWFDWDHLAELQFYLSHDNDATVPGRSYLEGTFVFSARDAELPSSGAFANWRVLAPGVPAAIRGARMVLIEEDAMTRPGEIRARLYPIFPDEWTTIDGDARLELLSGFTRTGGWFTITSSHLLLDAEEVAAMRPRRLASLFTRRERYEWFLHYRDAEKINRHPDQAEALNRAARNALAFIDREDTGRDELSALDHPSFTAWERLEAARFPLPNPSAVSSPSTKTSRLRWRFQVGESFGSFLAVSDGLVQIDGHGRFFALDAATGHERWRFGVEPGSSLQKPTVVPGSVYLSSGDQNVYALDAHTGLERWRFATGGNVLSSFVPANGNIHFGGSDNRIYALDADSGQERWRFTTGHYVDHLLTDQNGNIFAGSRDKHVYALDGATGVERWRWTSEGRHIKSMASLTKAIFVHQFDNEFVALHAATGEVMWTYNPETRHAVMALVGGTVYIQIPDQLIAVDALTGAARWRTSIGGWIRFSPVAADGKLFVDSHSSGLSALDTETGEILWRTADGQGFYDSAVADGVVYAGSEDHFLHAFDAGTGEERWREPTGEAVVRAPQIVDGVIYATTYRRDVLAIEARP